MRARGLVVAAVVTLGAGSLAGCGGGGDGGRTASSETKPPGGSVAAILARPGPNIAAVPGTGQYTPGPVRLSFLLIDNQGSSVERPTARVWIARRDDAVPFERATATLEPIGVPGSSHAAALGVTRIYVVHFSVPRVGIYTVAIEPNGGRRVQAMLHIQVRAHSEAREVGSMAPRSNTPTMASTHGDLARLTTRTPPDRDLLQYSIADSIAAHKPFVVAFATPKFCTSRTCGPVVDVVEAVHRKLESSGVRFIHVEVYEDNNPGKGFNRWFKEWNLLSEPWTFLVGADGRIKARFEGSVSVSELEAAVSRYL